MSMPGNRELRCAAMTCSMGTKRSPSGMTTNLGRRGGTLTRAISGGTPGPSRTTTARFSERLEMYGKGWAGSMASDATSVFVGLASDQLETAAMKIALARHRRPMKTQRSKRRGSRIAFRCSESAEAGTRCTKRLDFAICEGTRAPPTVAIC